MYAGCSTPDEDSAVPGHDGQICTLPAAPRGGCRPPPRRAPLTPPVTERRWTRSQVRVVFVSPAPLWQAWRQHLRTSHPSCLCCAFRRVAVSAVGGAARGGRADKLVRAFGLAAPAAPDAAAAGAPAGSGGAAASGEQPPRHAARQQPGQRRLGRPPAQHGDRQQCRRRRKPPVIRFPQLPVPFSTVSAAKFAERGGRRGFTPHFLFDTFPQVERT